jgi:hypothetical protein
VVQLNIDTQSLQMCKRPEMQVEALIICLRIAMASKNYNPALFHSLEQALDLLCRQL